MEIENSINSKMENIFYAALALHVAGKPLNKENIRAVLHDAGTPVDDPTLDMITAFIESLKVSYSQNDNGSDSKIVTLLNSVLSQQKGSAGQLEAVRTATISTKNGRYVYGITAGGKEVKLGPIGIDGSEVYIISYQNLGAIVHDCLNEPYQSSDDEKVKEWVKKHQNVLDIAREQFKTIIPLGFDTILKPAENSLSANQVVKDWLKADYDRFQDVIARIEGKDEYAVQISYNPSSISRYMSEPGEEIRIIREQLSKKSPGIAYLLKQKLEKAIKADMERTVDSLFNDFYNRINKYTDEVIVEKNRRPEKDKLMLLNLSCLVDKDKVGSLGEELEKINNMEGFFVHFSGPWPPYSFVAKPIEASAKEG
jgi:hypothetical protein